MHSADGRWVLAYNGELYHFEALRKELEARGHPCPGRSDTRVVVEAIAAWGLEAALERFVGMFAFAAFDRRRRELHLVRDRLGLKPLAWGRFGRHFLFASELCALEAHPSFEPRLDRSALAAYAQRGCVPAPLSIYQGVEKLPPGGWLCLGLDRPEPRLRRWWSLAREAEAGAASPFQGDEEEATRELEARLRDAVGARLVADVPRGILLSGGIDSSLVAALAQEQRGSPLLSFTVASEDARYDESDPARAVAARLGTEHVELRLGADEAARLAPELGARWDEPFADSSQLPTWWVCRQARRQVTVALSGDGGDEVFAGYHRHRFAARVLGAARPWPRLARHWLGRGLLHLPPRAVDRLEPWIGLRMPGEKLHKLARVLDAPDAPSLYRRLTQTWSEPSRIVLAPGPAAPEPAWPALPDVARQLMLRDAQTYLPDDLLVKVDRASMSEGLEVRVPLLDHRLLAFAASLPLDFHLRAGVGKRMLRRVLVRHLPPELFERPKAGFAVPVGDWLRGPLRDWAETLLAERRLREAGAFQPERVRALWTEHLSGRREHGARLWTLVQFESWREARGRRAP